MLGIPCRERGLDGGGEGGCLERWKYSPILQGEYYVEFGARSLGPRPGIGRLTLVGPLGER